MVQLGYRFGMLASGAGALVLAGQFGWSTAFLIMAALIGAAIAAVVGPVLGLITINIIIF